MATRLNVEIDAPTAETMGALRRRYETTKRAVQVAMAVAALVVDAWQNGWPVIIERPNGSYRLTEERSVGPRPVGRVVSPVRVVYIHRNREGRARP